VATRATAPAPVARSGSGQRSCPSGRESGSRAGPVQRRSGAHAQEPLTGMAQSPWQHPWPTARRDDGERSTARAGRAAARSEGARGVPTTAETRSSLLASVDPVGETNQRRTRSSTPASADERDRDRKRERTATVRPGRPGGTNRDRKRAPIERGPTTGTRSMEGIAQVLDLDEERRRSEPGVRLSERRSQRRRNLPPVGEAHRARLAACQHAPVERPMTPTRGQTGPEVSHLGEQGSARVTACVPGRSSDGLAPMGHE
jgi:hypothetical protein